MIDEEVTSFKQFITLVHKLSFSWDFIWFRGVDDVKYTPTPGLFWRKFKKKDSESSLVHDFLVTYKAILGSQVLSAWELYFLMQHHGLPTRLLDWTKSPLMALYFALERNPDFEGKRVVWVMNPAQLNNVSLRGEYAVFCPSEFRSKIIVLPGGSKLNLDSYLPSALDETDAEDYPDFPMAIEPPLCNARILAQSGSFTIHGNEKHTILKAFERVEEKKRQFGRIVIPGKKARNLMLHFLYSMGIKEETVYQDLDSLSKRIIREYT
jgi:hypothetical protein